MIADERRARLAETLREHGLDVLVLYGNAWQGDYLRYATDFGLLEGQGIAVVRSDGDVTFYLDSPLEADRAAVEAPGIEIVLAANLLDAVDRVFDRSGNARIAAGPARLLPRRFAKRKDELKIADATAIVDSFLMRKLRSEYEAIRSAARLADEGYAVFRNAARPGRADYELIAEIEMFFRAHGVDDNFQIIGVGGPEVRGMAPPQGKRLKAGDLVTTELTPCVDGYYSQICRTLVVGDANEAQRTAFGIWKESMEAGIATVRPGVTAGDIARAENDVFRKYGLGDYVTSEYTRVRGHGLGLFADTKPHILEDVTTVIEEGMTMIVHPNTYNPNVGYLVLGDALGVTATGAEIFCGTTRELFQTPLS